MLSFDYKRVFTQEDLWEDMGRIVAVAGGDLSSTQQLNMYAVRLSGKRNPNVLFIGTASHDAEGYIETITREYTFLGCSVKSLRLVTDSYRDDEINALLSWADIIKAMTGLAMENNTAVVFDNGKCYFIRSTSTAKAFFIRYREGLIEKEEVAFETV